MGMARFVQRMELMRHCVGESRASQTAIDVSLVLSDAALLQELVADLFRPFAQRQVDQILALHMQTEANLLVERDRERESGDTVDDNERDADTSGGCGGVVANGIMPDVQEEEAEDGDVHHFTTAIAGAMAGVKQLGAHGTGFANIAHACMFDAAAYGEVTVITRSQPRSHPAVIPARSSKLKSNGASKQAKKGERGLRESVCHRIAAVEVGDRCVELKRQVVQEGKRVLLVADWIDQEEGILAARDALTKLGVDVVGVCFVVATNVSLLDALKSAQLPYSCSWTPSSSAEIVVSGSRRSGGTRRVIVEDSDTALQNANCCCHQAGSRKADASKKRKRNSADDAAMPPPLLTYYTAQYQGNNPSEDRSVNITKASDEGVRISAVFDGHGGSIAVEHLRKTLCQRILSSVSTEASIEKVTEQLKQSFAACDEELKQSLLSLEPETRLLKGYCNTGSCAVVALFVSSVLYVANVGDCVAVIGKRDPESGECVADQLSVDHNCSNSDEVRLVLERSRDRNAIRLSKDDQANGAGGFGVKRVAGSLAVTRAFGDFYLKSEELSTPPFKSKVPYIAVEPSVSVHQLDGNEKYLILASDGLWEVLTPDEAVQIVDKFGTISMAKLDLLLYLSIVNVLHHSAVSLTDPSQSLFFSSVSAALIHAALEKLAHRDGLMLHELLALPAGPERRRFHDDITCTVVYISQDAADAEKGQTVDSSLATVTEAASDSSLEMK
ncbi:Protein phosphatase, partial [Globisporangium splendens]